MQGREGAFSKWCELLIVVTIAFGLLIWSSLSAVARDAIEPVFSDASLWGMVVYELLVLAILLPVLWFRGWRPQSVGLQWQLRDLAAGLGLLAVCLLLTYPLTLLNWSSGSNTNPFDAMVAGRLSIAAVLGPRLVSPVSGSDWRHQYLDVRADPGLVGGPTRAAVAGDPGAWRAGFAGLDGLHLSGLA
ncbi:hypothetical protein [Xanthomonas euvesicatoria]|uniref:hypothetical protein n=1 Tax=Xanthomonas euvesicatoria TaxID=456327 RepID=UPI000A4AFD4F